MCKVYRRHLFADRRVIVRQPRPQSEQKCKITPNIRLEATKAQTTLSQIQSGFTRIGKNLAFNRINLGLAVIAPAISLLPILKQHTMNMRWEVSIYFGRSTCMCQALQIKDMRILVTLVSLAVALVHSIDHQTPL